MDSLLFFFKLKSKIRLKDKARFHLSDLLKERVVFSLTSTFVTTIIYKRKKDFHVCCTTKQEISRKERCQVIMVRSIRSSFWMEENFLLSIQKRTKNSSWNGLYSIVARDAHSFWIVANLFFIKEISVKLKKYCILILPEFCYWFLYSIFHKTFHVIQL